MKLIPEFRSVAPPEKPTQGTFGDFSAGCLPVQGENEITPDLESTPPLVPRWRIYPFYMNPPVEVPQRGECDVYLLLHKYSVWRCPPGPPAIRRTRLGS